MPELKRYASMEQASEVDGLSVRFDVPSPTQDDSRTVVIWVDETSTPSISFGPSHTHENPSDDIIDLAKAIFSDRLIFIEEIGGAHPGHSHWIDLRDKDALAEELTNPYSPGKVFLKSWSGKLDRRVDTENL